MNKYICSLLLLVLISCGKGEDKEVVEDKNKLVRYSVVVNTMDEINRTFAGTVKSDDQFKLSFRVSGTVEELRFNIGDKIKKGETLGRLDDDTYNIDLRNKEAAYETAIADLLKSEANLENSENEYNRIEQLYLEDSVSKSDYDIAKSNYSIALAELKGAKANVTSSKIQVENSKLQLRYTSLVSSSDGYIVSREAKVDETVDAGTPVYTISPSDDLKVVTALPESLITKISRGDLVDVTLNSIEGKVFRGKIIEVGKAPVESSSNYPVKVKIDTNSDIVKSGMSAKVDFNIGDEKDTLFIPLSSISEDHNNNIYIYKISDINGSEGVVTKTNIKVGSIEKDGIEVLDGVAKGDYIITAGVTQIKNNQRVRIELEGAK